MVALSGGRGRRGDHARAGGRGQTSFPIPTLAINREPTRGRPDVVIRHRTSNVLTIIERKSTHAEIPLDGWPDLRAQLRCYAQFAQYKAKREGRD